MEHSHDSAEMLEQIIYPAFIVEGHVIIKANQAASCRGITTGIDVFDVIAIGADEYRQYSDGKLCLTLIVNDIRCNATVTAMDSGHLFCLETDYDDPNLRAFALVAQQLRNPLANAMISAEQLLSDESANQDAQSRQHLAQINRSLNQLLRAVGNMSDSAAYVAERNFRMQLIDITATFAEILEKVSGFVSESGKSLQYRLPNEPIYTMADAEKLERAILNLLSNAIRHTPSSETVFVDIRRNKDKLFITVTDSGDGIDAAVHGTLFARFLREPGIEKGNLGIGLGMTIVRAVAAAHNGTVLLEKAETGGAKFTMTIGIIQSTGNVVCTPILLPIDYAGGRDHVLLELSDVLPCSLYENTV